jgi:hypothetical protein
VAAYVNPGYRGVQEATYGGYANLYTWPDVDGATVDQTEYSATFAVYRPGIGSPDGTAVTSGSCTIDSNNKITADINISNTSIYTLSEGWRCEITMAALNDARKVIVFDIVRQPLLAYIPVRVDDLKRLHVQAAQMLAQQSISGSNMETYAHQFIIQPAWQRVIGDVIAAGKRPALISPPETLYQVALHASAELMFQMFMRAPGDVWDVQRQYHAERYTDVKKALVLRYAEADNFSHHKDRSWNEHTMGAGNDMADSTGTVGVGLGVFGWTRRSWRP